MRKARIVIAPEMRPYPTPRELEVAGILVKYFGADVEILARRRQKTADFLIDGVDWELKSPTGSGKHNIQHQFQRAGSQARCFVLDLKESKMYEAKAMFALKAQFLETRQIREVIVIRKDGSLIHLKK